MSNYVAGFAQAKQATDRASKSAQEAAARFEAQNQSMTKLGTGLLAMGTLAAVGVGLAIAKYAEFDEAIAKVSATGADATNNIEALREAALDAGARTVFSATEAANAIEELAKAGVDAKEILDGGLDGALALAAAGGLDVADAASIAATALNTFNLEGADMAHVADLLAAGAGKAMGDVSDLGAALNQSALLAKSTGLSIDETTAALSAFASQGLLGSDAGTSFKAMLQRLTPQSAEAQEEMDRLGISAYDAAGKFIGLEEFSGNLATSLAGLTDEQRNATLATIFGSDAVRAATVLYEEGADGIAKWENKVNDSGYAAETAAKRLDNLKGDVEQLGGAFDTALIRSGSAADGVLRLSVQTLTDLVNIYNSAPLPVQQTALALGALAAAGLLVTGAFLVAIPKVAEFQIALATLRTSNIPGVAAAAVGAQTAVTKMGGAMSSAARFLVGPWGIALAAAAVGVSLLTKMIEAGQTSSNEFANALKRAATGAELLALATKSDGATTALFGDYADALKDLPGLLDKSTAAADQFLGFMNLSTNELGAVDALDRLGKSLGTLAAEDLPAAQKGFRAIATQYDLTTKQQGKLLRTMPAYEEALKAQATQLGVNVTSSDKAANKTALLELAFGEATPTALEAADAYLAAADQAAGLNDEVTGLVDAINKANGIGIDAVSANIAYQDALSKVAEQIANVRAGTEGYAAGLDVATQAGRDNYNVLLDQAEGGQAAADAQFALDGNTKNYVAALQANRDKVLQNARDLGATDAQVQYLSDHIVAMPNQKQIDIIADTWTAQRQIDAFIANTNARVATITVNATNPAIGFGLGDGHATGGAIYGPGTGTSDSIFARLSNGEHVLTAADVAAMGGQASVYAWRRTLHGMPAYADGGHVQPQYVTGGGSSGRSAAGATFNSTVQIVPQPGKSVWQQSLEASRWVRYSFGYGG
ncbi:hypothetical protein ASC59_05260 [Leifsonia sp. Root1293]|nr:hypothetical protein ASC59_05260 [Leifsonia sp. Root1293]KRA11489.1 hypothetical protein ASD61_05260 [Leifsonia sp. Root60]